MGAKLLRGFAYVWFCLAGGLIFASYVAIWYTDGFGKVQEILSPFNVINFVVTIITLSPGIGAYMLAERLERRASESSGAAPRNTSPDFAEVESLVQSYGAALEAAAKATVVDAKRLPASKEKIKSALLVALHATQDHGMREQLKVAYMELSSFQPGVGGFPVAFDLSNIPDANDPEAIRGTAQSIVERGPEVERWSTIASQERDQLVEELKNAGFWEPAV